MPSDLEDDGFLDFTVLMHCAIYALVRRGVVVYIGQSKSVGERMQTHIRKRKGGVRKSGYYSQMKVGFSFDAIWICECMFGELDKLEEALIKKYQPKYNQKLMPAKPSLDLQMLIEMMPAVCMQPQSDSLQPRQTAPWRRL